MTGVRFDAAGRQHLQDESTTIRALLQPGEVLPADAPGFLPNTGPAVAGYAEAYGAGVAGPVRRLLFDACWTGGADIGNPEVLRRLLAGPIRAGHSTSLPLRDSGYAVSLAGGPITTESLPPYPGLAHGLATGSRPRRPGAGRRWPHERSERRAQPLCGPRFAARREGRHTRAAFRCAVSRYQSPEHAVNSARGTGPVPGTGNADPAAAARRPTGGMPAPAGRATSSAAPPTNSPNEDALVSA